MDKPQSVRLATLLWSAAVASGVAETALAVTEIAGEGGLGVAVWVQIGIRAVVYTGAGLLVLNFAKGRRWARTSLFFLLSVIGFAAMLVPSLALMADGETFLHAFGSDGPLALPFTAVRLLHIAAVLGATAAMFTLAANAYFAERSAVQAPV